MGRPRRRSQALTGRPVTLRSIAAALAAVMLAAGCGQDDKPEPREPNEYVLSRSDAPATIWAVGDAGHDGEREPDVAKLVKDADPDLLLYLGDVYETGTPAEFKVYDKVWGALAPRTAPVMGNHERPNKAKGYDPYWRSKKGTAPPERYSFRMAGWELIGLNSEARSAQIAKTAGWLRKRVASPGNCRLAFWHSARYTAGLVHGDDPSVAPFWNAVAGRAKLVVSAHEHNMQRLRPRDGIVEVISGAGGHGNPYPLRSTDRRLAFSDAETDGALRIKLAPGRAQLEFVATGGRVLDSKLVRCSRR